MSDQEFFDLMHKFCNMIRSKKLSPRSRTQMLSDISRYLHQLYGSFTGDVEGMTPDEEAKMRLDSSRFYNPIPPPRPDDRDQIRLEYVASGKDTTDYAAIFNARNGVDPSGDGPISSRRDGANSTTSDMNYKNLLSLQTRLKAAFKMFRTHLYNKNVSYIALHKELAMSTRSIVKLRDLYAYVKRTGFPADIRESDFMAFCQKFCVDANGLTFGEMVTLISGHNAPSSTKLHNNSKGRHVPKFLTDKTSNVKDVFAVIHSGSMRTVFRRWDTDKDRFLSVDDIRVGLHDYGLSDVYVNDADFIKWVGSFGQEKKNHLTFDEFQLLIDDVQSSGNRPTADFNDATNFQFPEDLGEVEENSKPSEIMLSLIQRYKASMRPPNLTQCFRILDSDNKLTLNLADLFLAINLTGVILHKDMAKVLFQVFDQTNSGQADYMEMLSMLQQDFNAPAAVPPQLSTRGSFGGSSAAAPERENSYGNGSGSSRERSTPRASDMNGGNDMDWLNGVDSSGFNNSGVVPSVPPEKRGAFNLKSTNMYVKEADHIGNMVGGNLDDYVSMPMTGRKADRAKDLHALHNLTVAEAIHQNNQQVVGDDISSHISRGDGFGPGAYYGETDEVLSSLSSRSIGNTSARSKYVAQQTLPPRINPALGRATAQARRHEFLQPQASMNNILEQHVVRSGIPPPGHALQGGNQLPPQLIPVVQDIAHNVQKQAGRVRSVFETYTQKRMLMTKSDFMRAMISLNIQMQDPEAQAIMQAFSCKSDGSLTYSDFMRLINFT